MLLKDEENSVINTQKMRAFVARRRWKVSLFVDFSLNDFNLWLNVMCVSGAICDGQTCELVTDRLWAPILLRSKENHIQCGKQVITK